MKERIIITLDTDHHLNCEEIAIARRDENDVKEFEIKLLDSLNDYWAYIDFEKSDGTKIKTPKLNVTNGMAYYVIPNSLVDTNGELKTQIVLQKETGEVWKSDTKIFYVENSINATDDIPDKEDFITQAQKTLSDIENGLTPTIGENGNWFITGQDTGKPSQGEKGDKGDKGDAGSIKFIITNDLPTENIEVNVIYMIPSGETSGENTYKEYIYVNGAWESLGSASVQVDLDGYVKTTDYATDTTGGVVKVGGNYGISMRSNGILQIATATLSMIDEKTNIYRTITPSNLDYAVGSVKASQTQSGTAKMWVSTNADGDVGLNISTEV